MRKLVAILFADIAGYTARMGADEPDALRLRQRARERVRSSVARCSGQVLEEIGDGTLAIFESAVESVGCACEIQRGLAEDRDLRLHIGIHVGDVILEAGRATGDGVNVASRIHDLAEPGKICVSERVHADARNQPGLRWSRLGPRRLKNVADPLVVYEVTDADAPMQRLPVRRRWLVAATIALALAALGLSPVRDRLLAAWVVHAVPLFSERFEQQIAFAKTGDGVRIAWAGAGQGRPVVYVLGWFSHLERGLNSPAYDSVVARLVSQHRVIRYDGRGTGLSDREVSDFSLEARVRDVEAVVEASGLERFALMGVSLGGPTAIAYAARHPERVSRLVLCATFASSPNLWTLNPAWDGIITTMRTGWGQESAAGRQAFASLAAPDAPPAGVRILSELFAISTPGPTAAAIADASREIDVRPLLAKLSMPTLVVHSDGDLLVPLAAARELAAGIPGARFVVVHTNNHALPPIDEGGRKAYEEVAAFLGAEAGAPAVSNHRVD